MRLPMRERCSAEGQSVLAILHFSFRFGGIGYGEQHAGVGAAATQVAAECLGDFFGRSIGMFARESGGRRGCRSMIPQ